MGRGRPRGRGLITSCPAGRLVGILTAALTAVAMLAGCTSGPPNPGRGFGAASGDAAGSSSTPVPARSEPISPVPTTSRSASPGPSVPRQIPAPDRSARPPATSTAARSTAARAPVPSATAPAAARPPLAYSGSAGQLVTVVAASGAATSATLTAWQRTASGWQAVVGPVFAWVGYGGVGTTREGLSRAPAGTFALTQAFGNQPNNGSGLPYFQAGIEDWWDENPASATYNRHVVRSSSPGGASENLYTSGPAYAHAVNIDYNTNPVVPGAGSAFFLHVTEGHPTQGCVSIEAGVLNAIMRWLSPPQRPVIQIGVG